MQGRAALHQAVSNGCLLIVQILLSRGASVEALDDYGRPIIDYVTNSSGEEAAVARLLLNSGAGVTGWNVLHQAARGEAEFELMRFYLDRGVDVNAVDGNGLTALHNAVLFNSDVGHAEFLLKNGAELEAGDKRGRTVMHMVVRPRSGMDAHQLFDELISVWTSRGGEIDATDNNGRTPVHVAAKEASPATILDLIHKGAEIEATDKFGRTPLHAAYEGGEMESIEVLIKSGANIEASDNRGKTPLFVAVAEGFPETVDLLIHRGANFEVILETFDPIVTKFIKKWTNLCSQRWGLRARWLRSLRWCFEQAAVAQSSYTGFQVVLDQFFQDHENEFIVFMQHFDALRLVSLAGKFDSPGEEKMMQEIMDEYKQHFQLSIEHGVNIEKLEEHMWEKNGVTLPISWLYSEDTRFNFDWWNCS